MPSNNPNPRQPHVLTEEEEAVRALLDLFFLIHFCSFQLVSLVSIFFDTIILEIDMILMDFLFFNKKRQPDTDT